MAPKKVPQSKEKADVQALNADTTSCELTAASLEATLYKFLAEANKLSKDQFEQLENQLNSIKMTLEKHSKELDSRRKITTSLQAEMKPVEDSTTEHKILKKASQENVFNGKPKQ